MVNKPAILLVRLNSCLHIFALLLDIKVNNLSEE